METLENRVETLERENRRLKRGALLALVVGLAVVALGVASPPKISDEIRTRKLIVEDGSGGTALLSVANGTPSLFFSEQGGMPRMMLAESGLSLFDEAWRLRGMFVVSKNGPLLSLDDEAGKSRLALVADQDGPSLTLNDRNGKQRGKFIANKGKDGPALFFGDEEGKPRVKLAASGLSLLDEAGKLRAALGQAKEDSAELSLYDDAGKLRGMFAVSKNVPLLTLTDEAETSRLALVADQDGPSLTLTDQNGNLRGKFVAAKEMTMLALGDKSTAKPRVTLMVIKDQTRLDMFDETLRGRMALEVTKGGPSVHFFDEEGKTAWMAPK